MYKAKDIRDSLKISQDKINRMTKKGIIHPDRDPENKYRLFSEEDMRNAMLTNAWLELGLSYSEIVPLLDSSNQDLDKTVKKLQNDLKEKIKTLQAQNLACEMLLMTGSMEYVIDLLNVEKQDELIPKIQKAFTLAGEEDRRKRQNALYQDADFNHGFRMINNLRKKGVPIEHKLVKQYVNLMESASEKHFQNTGAKHLLAFADLLGTSGEFSKRFNEAFGEGCTDFMNKAINYHLMSEGRKQDE